MDGEIFSFILDDESGTLSPEEYAIGCLRWFMLHSGLYAPECLFCDKDGTMQSYRPEDFDPLHRRQVRFDNCASFVGVAGVDESDTSRVTLTYVFGSSEVFLTFPQQDRLNAKSKAFLERFRKQLDL